MNGYLSACVRTRALVFAFVLFLLPYSSFARLLQIIHTNDLHSHFEHAGNPEIGGYAAVKATIDRMKDEARAKGIDTLTLDAGDFSEGTQFFLVDNGEASWKTIDAMGYDAIVMGNHDYLMGQVDLDRVVGHANPRTPILGSNFIFDARRRNLSKHIQPSIRFNRAGLNIAVLGLTTDAFVYNWRAEEGFIFPPIWDAVERLPDLARNNDLVIALTHIGVNDDRKLVKNTKGIDIVIGGHSHTILHTPILERDKRNHTVPIVQTGEHGEYVGSLLVNVEPGKSVEVVEYHLEPVMNAGPHDNAIDHLVRESREKLEKEYGRDWLYETVGYSEVPVVRPNGGPTEWGALVIDAIRETSKSDVALDVAEFYGDNMPAGPITREQLFSFYPRVFDFNRYGWTVWQTTIRGWILKLALKYAVEKGYLFNTSGITWDTVVKGSKRSIKNVKIGGKSLKLLKNYKVGLPEGIGRGAVEIFPFMGLIFKNTKDTGVPIWFSIEKKLRSLGTVKPWPKP